MQELLIAYFGMHREKRVSRQSKLGVRRQRQEQQAQDASIHKRCRSATAHHEAGCRLLLACLLLASLLLLGDWMTAAVWSQGIL